MDLLKILRALPVIGPVLVAVPEVKDLIDGAISMLHPADQTTAKAALADLMAENDEGHARLQEKLAAAAKR